MPKSLLVACASLVLLGAGCLPWPLSLVENAVRGDKGEEASYDDSYGSSSYYDDYSSSGGTSIPYNFPSDIPVYSVYGVTSAEVTYDGSWMTMTTTDSPYTVQAWYESELAYEGWTSVGTYDDYGATTLVYAKGSRALGIAIADDYGVTSIVISEQTSW